MKQVRRSHRSILVGGRRGEEKRERVVEKGKGMKQYWPFPFLSRKKRKTDGHNAYVGRTRRKPAHTHTKRVTHTRKRGTRRKGEREGRGGGADEEEK